MTNNTQSGSDIDVTRKDTPTEVEAHSIKGTQELDEILDGFARAVRVVVVNGLSHDKYERRQKDFKQAVLDWHNKQIEAVLDRLESKSSEWSVAAAELLDHLENRNLEYIPLSAIEAERNKLKERDDE